MRVGATLAVVTALGAAVAHAALPASNETGIVRGDSVSLSNSRQGSAVLTAQHLRPGESVKGRVKIANSGDLASVLRLGCSDLQEAVGPNGGRLSEKLDLLLEDVSSPGSPVIVYSGKLGQMRTLTLGRLEPGESHTYRLMLSFPEGGSADNVYQGSSMSARFDWTAVQA